MTKEESRDRLTRWRLVLGGEDADGIGQAPGSALEGGLSQADAERDKALGELYDGNRRGGMGRSAPRVARWLGDIRTYFPSSVVQVMQADAMERLRLRQRLLEPELVESGPPHLRTVSTPIRGTHPIPGPRKDP